MQVRYEWRGRFDNAELNALHAEGFGHGVLDDDWLAQVERHSLGWVVARGEADELLGFVNVPWDGGVHAFILDTVVAQGARRQGVGRQLVGVAEREVSRAGCEWLHADYDQELVEFYEAGCGFRATPAGLIEL
jgi:GNAT superfamily N-acetyltransferase